MTATATKNDAARMLWFGVGRSAVAKRPAAGMLLMTTEGTVLLTHRASWMNDGDLWSTPGGVIETQDGETAREGALREVNEELDMGLRFADLEYLEEHVNWNLRRSYTVYVVGVEKEHAIGTLDHENQDARWMTIEEALTLPLHYQLLPLLKELQGTF